MFPLNSIHPLGALPPFVDAPGDNPKETSLPDYSQAPLTFEMGVPLGASIRRTAVDNAGSVKTAGWWDHARETWDAEFDAEKHIKRFDRLADDPAHFDYKTQVLAVPYKPFGDPAALLTVHLLDETGRPKDVARNFGRNEIGVLCHLGY